MDPRAPAVEPPRQIQPLRREEQRPLPQRRERRPATQPRRRDPAHRIDEYAGWQ